MLKSKKAFCLLFALLMALASLSAAFYAAAEDAGMTAAEPLTVQVEMSKSVYFVTAKAKATVIVQNTGSETLKNISVSAFSEKHLLPKGSESCLLIPELEVGQSKKYTFEMALDRKHAGVMFIERVLLFFAQLFRAYEPMQSIVVPLPDYVAGTQNAVLTQEAAFRHGSANAVLEVQVWYQTGTGTAVDPVDPVPRPQVTYLEKYVIDILKSGVYTMTMDLTQDGGQTLPCTIYEDENNRALEMTLTGLIAQNMELPALFANVGQVRFIIQDKKSANPKAYIAWPGFYCEVGETGDFADMIEDGQTLSLEDLAEGLEYCGYSIVSGAICETYKDAEENTLFRFYFAQVGNYAGIVRFDTVDLTTGKTETQTVMRLTPGVTNDKAFTVSGKKIDPADIERLFGS